MDKTSSPLLVQLLQHFPPSHCHGMPYPCPTSVPKPWSTHLTAAFILTSLPSQPSTEHFPGWSSYSHPPTACLPPPSSLLVRMPCEGNSVQCMESFSPAHCTTPLHTFPSLTVPQDSGQKMSCGFWFVLAMCTSTQPQQVQGIDQ